MKELSEKAAYFLDKAFDEALVQLHLEKIYGPADRHGATEWMALHPGMQRDGLPPTVKVFVSFTAWPEDDYNEFDVTAESTAAVRTPDWVYRFESGSYRLSLEDPDHLRVAVTKVMAATIASRSINDVMRNTANHPGFRPKEAVDLL